MSGYSRAKKRSKNKTIKRKKTEFLCIKKTKRET